ncbi:hypothetical protein AXW78_30620 (plasmid) [Bacillus thuringiensis]|nr:hypothetical protein AXW78_30620 [Bacillus thuringiensis]
MVPTKMRKINIHKCTIRRQINIAKHKIGMNSIKVRITIIQKAISIPHGAHCIIVQNQNLHQRMELVKYNL